MRVVLVWEVWNHSRSRPEISLLDVFGKNSNDSEREMDSTEESIAGAAAIHLWLTQPRCSPIAYADIVSNDTSPLLRFTNPQSH